MSEPAERVHGGPDARGRARWDFSTNVNAAGPCPQAMQALARADATSYPDPAYHDLRERLAAWHAVNPRRIVLAASASEFIQRVTAVGQRLAPGAVQVPARAYGDYALAARACARALLVDPAERATLRWCADPSSPLGQDAPPMGDAAEVPTVLDLAYAPLRLYGSSAWDGEAGRAVFRLYSPNKALGLPGIRGAYAIAPEVAQWPVDDWCRALRAAEPSWPLGAHALAVLECWTEPSTQAWLDCARSTLRAWVAELRQGLDALGLQPASSVTPFLCARVGPGATPRALREHGLAVRDATSFGMPGWMRLSAQPPLALRALFDTLGRLLHAGAPTSPSPEVQAP